MIYLSRFKRLTMSAILSALFVLLLVGGLAFVAQAAPSFARTTVDGTWGLKPTSIALSGAQTLTPTVSLYLLAPTATMTLTLATGDARQGDFIYLIGTTGNDTIIVDTGATAGGSTRTISDLDVIGFIFNGTAWVEAFFSDNS